MNLGDKIRALKRPEPTTYMTYDPIEVEIFTENAALDRAAALADEHAATQLSNDERLEYQQALIWCSGSADFAPEGQAREGWLKLCKPLIDRQPVEGASRDIWNAWLDDLPLPEEFEDGIAALQRFIAGLPAEAHESALVAAADHQRENKNQAYRERNMLVALLASMFPSGIARTDIDGWNPEWHGCVYIDFPWGQASWHYHDSQADLFSHLPPYAGVWDGHKTDDKYNAIMAAARLGGFKATVAAAYEAAAQEADDVLDNSDAVSDHASAAPNSYGAGYDAGERAAAHTIAEAIRAMTDADAAAALARIKAEARREALSDFTKADWFWRDLDPDDSGDTPDEAINAGMVGRFTVCHIRSSFTGPDRFCFIAPVLDPESDEDECLCFETEDEAIAAAKERSAILKAAGEEKQNG